MFGYFTPFLVFYSTLGAVLSLIPILETVTYIIMYSICFFNPPFLWFSFFFLEPVAGLTNRVPVRDSRAGAPLSPTLAPTLFYIFGILICRPEADLWRFHIHG